jgi:imidazolonepropionase-like amidohydrolase
VYQDIDDGIYRGTRMFLVATAPLYGEHVNVSPKGLDTLRILDPWKIASLDYVGSGAETIAHVRENELAMLPSIRKIERVHPSKRTLRSALATVFILAVGCAREPALVARQPNGSRSVILHNVRVFDAPHAQLLEGLRDVVVREGWIETITSPAPAGTAAGLPEIDGHGGVLLPGLVDAHTHTSASAYPPWRVTLPDVVENLSAFLYAGVTTVLDLGSLSPDVFRERERVAKGEHLGPRMFAAGPIFTAPGGHPVEMLRTWLPWYLRWYVVPRATREVATAEDARRAVAALLPERPDILKVAIDAGPGNVPLLSQETVAAVTAAGHAAGLRTITHIGSSAEAIAAVRGGSDALAHAAWREEFSDEAVGVISSAHVPVVVTLAVFDLAGAPRTRVSEFLPIEREVAGRGIIDALLAPPPALDHDTAAVFRAAADAYEARRHNVTRLRAAGVAILVGSDACNPGDLPGAGLHLELAKLVAAGLTPGEALRAATWENARFLAGDQADFGEITVGKRADLVLVAGDPTAVIGDLGKITHVLLGGAVLERHSARGSNLAEEAKSFL